MKRLFAIATSVLMLLAGIAAKGQTVSKTADFSSFNSIEASEDLEITLKHASASRVVCTVDEGLEDYLETYVKNKTLYLTFNKKALTKELKKKYKGKNAPKPILKVTVQVPSIEVIRLTDNVVLDASGQDFSFSDFSISAVGKSRVNNLKIKSGKVINLQVSGNARVNADVTCENLLVNINKSGMLDLNQHATKLNFVTDDSALANISGNAGKVSIENSGRSKLNFLSGKANSLTTSSSGSSEVNALDFPVTTASLVMNGSSIHLKAEKSLKLELDGEAVVEFAGKPVLDVVSILDSSLYPYVPAEPESATK